MTRYYYGQLFGSDANGLDMLQRFVGDTASQSLEDLASWLEDQFAGLARENGWDIPEGINWDDIAEQLLEDAAYSRTRRSTDLYKHEETIKVDWPNREEHLFWVALAPEAEIIDWAERIEEEVEKGRLSADE